MEGQYTIILARVIPLTSEDGWHDLRTNPFVIGNRLFDAKVPLFFPPSIIDSRISLSLSLSLFSVAISALKFGVRVQEDKLYFAPSCPNDHCRIVVRSTQQKRAHKGCQIFDQLLSQRSVIACKFAISNKQSSVGTSLTCFLPLRKNNGVRKFNIYND